MSANIFSILRFTAAIIVILFHQQSNFEELLNLPAILLAGPQMVTFFLVLSGFILVIAYGQNDKILIKQFLAKRAFKIYPLYLVSLLLPILLFMAKGELGYLNLIFNLSLIQAWIPSGSSINGPTWFLSVLMFCYITFPVIYNRIKTFSFKPSFLLYSSLFLWVATQIILTVLLNTSFYQGYPSISHNLIFYFPLSHYCSFLLGLSGGLLLTQDFDRKSFHTNRYILLTISLLLIIVTIQFQDYTTELINIKFAYGSSFYAPFFLLLIGAVYLTGNRKKVNGELKIFAALGAVSFPMYVLQYPTASFIFYFTKKYHLNEYLTFLIYLFVLMIVSLIYVNYIEKYFQHFIIKKQSSKITQSGF